MPAYTVAARALHWLVAALVLLMIPLGIVIANEWGGPVQTPLYNLHKSIGAVLLPVIAVRLIYRWTHPPLPLPVTFRRFSNRRSHPLGALRCWSRNLSRLDRHAGLPALPSYSACLSCRTSGREPPAPTTVHHDIAMPVTAMHISAALHHHFVRIASSCADRLIEASWHYPAEPRPTFLSVRND
jgi:cytochrome b561